MIKTNALEQRWAKFNELSAQEFYAIAKLRQEVFIIEQACIYADLDDLDPLTHHLMLMQENNLTAYTRVLPPDTSEDPVYFSRVAVALSYRKQGLGTQLIQCVLEYIEDQFPRQEIVISAQNYLEKFYNKFGFERLSLPYTEDGIPHIAMRKLP